MSDRQLDDSSYHQFRIFLEKQCGIVLGENKQYLVKSRLAPLMAKFDVATLGDLVTRTLSPMERQLRASVIDAMTTNETLWFRDEYYVLMDFIDFLVFSLPIAGRALTLKSKLTLSLTSYP